MKVIDYNPASKIPDFTEHAFNTSVIIAIWESTYSLFFSYVIKSDNNIFKFRGSSKSKSNSNSPFYGRMITWSDSINSGHTLLHLITKDYIDRSYGGEYPWKVKYYIVDQLSELMEVMNMYSVHDLLLGEILKRFQEVNNGPR